MEPVKEISNKKYYFLQGGGELGALTRAFNWSQTPVGTPDEWPQSLRTTVSLILSSRFPMFLWWGGDLIQFYNDAYRPSLGNNGKHPLALGQKGKDCWPEIWHIIYPLISQVLSTGEATWSEDQLVPIYRNGKIEDVYWTFGYSPVRSESEKVEGVLVVCTETTEKVLNLKKLEAANRKFNNLVMQAPVAIAVFRGNNFVAETVNDAYLPLVGKTREEFVGRPLFESLPETKEVLEPLAREVVRTGMPFIANEFEMIINRNQRYDTCYFNSVWEPLREDDGSINGFVVVAHEITEQVLTRKKIEESEERFRTMAEGTDILIAVADETSNAAYFNNAWVNLTGRPMEYLLKFGWADLVHPEDRERYLNIYLSSFEKRKPFTGEFRILNKNGQYSWLLAKGPARFRTDGSFAGYISSCVDITERKQVEEQIQKLAAIIEASPEFIGLAALDTSAQYVNPAALKMLGWDSFDGRHIIDWVYPEDRAVALQLLPQLLEKGSFQHEIRFWNEKTGEPFWLQWNGITIKDTAADKIIGLATISPNITERKQAEKALQESEARYRTIIEETTVATALYTGPEIRVLYANDTMIRYWGKDRNVIGKTFREILPELETQPFPGLLEAVYATGQTYIGQEEKADLVVDGRLQSFYFNFTYKALGDADGKIYGIHHVAIDVTEQVVARKKVEESEQQVRTIMESAPFPIGVYVGKEMRIELANQAIMNTWGKGNNVIGKLFKEVLPELDNQSIFQQLDSVFTTGVPFHARHQRIDIDVAGKLQPFYFNYSLIPLRDVNGKVYGVVNTGADVTDLSLAKQKIEQSERNFRSMILQAPVAMCILLGPLHIVETANELMMELWGKTAEEVMYKPVFEGLPDARQQGLEELMEGVYNTGKTFRAYERPVVLFRNKKHETVYQNFVYEPYTASDGTILGILAISIDVTDQVIARQKIEEVVAERTRELAEANSNLQRSNAELAQFAYIASHDLQEPIRKVITFADMLQQSLGNIDERSNKYLGKIQESASRMHKLVRDVLTYSQLSKEKEVFALVDLHEIIENIKTDFELLIEQKGADIQYRPLPLIEGIPLQIAQLFGNLISNSLKFSRPGVHPVICITASALSDWDVTPGFDKDAGMRYYNIEFRDNGIGFQQQHAQQIFSIFQRLHGKAEYSGTGIGLAMCKKIAQNHHGYIYAKATPGTGAVFNVILPEKQTAR